MPYATGRCGAPAVARRLPQHIGDHGVTLDGQGNSGFAKENLDVEVLSMSSSLALPALIANDGDFIDRSYEFCKRAGCRRELVNSEPGVQGILDFLSETIPEAELAKSAQFFDDRFVRQVNSELCPLMTR